jgi:hypothetical protein
MRQLPPRVPYAPQDVVYKNHDHRIYYLDPIDIIRSHDQVAVDLFRIPLIQEGVRFYYKEDLELYSVQNLRTLASALSVNDATDNRELLIKAILFAQQIPVVLASPSPAYSAQELVTGRREGSPMSSNIRYPIISVRPLDHTDRQESMTRAVYRNITWVGDRQAVIQGFKPTPTNFPYQVECISTLKSHMNLMDAWVRRLWKFPVLTVDINLGEPWGVKSIQVLKNSSFSDETEYEQDATTAEKLVRHIHTITMESWFPSPVWLTTTVKRFTAGYYDMVTGTLLEDGNKQLLDQQ